MSDTVLVIQSFIYSFSTAHWVAVPAALDTGRVDRQSFAHCSMLGEGQKEHTAAWEGYIESVRACCWPAWELITTCHILVYS